MVVVGGGGGGGPLAAIMLRETSCGKLAQGGSTVPEITAACFRPPREKHKNTHMFVFKWLQDIL